MAIKSINKKNLSKSQILLGKEIKILKVSMTLNLIPSFFPLYWSRLDLSVHLIKSSPDRNMNESDPINFRRLVDAPANAFHFSALFAQELQHENIVALYDVQVSLGIF